jgi:hydroxypyruvate isomerase
MERRKFIRNAALSGMALTGITGTVSAASAESKKSNQAKFKLKYAPSLGTFREHAGNDPIDEIRFMHDQGFRAIFDNGLMGKEPALQEKIASELDRRGMDLGPFVLYADFGVTSMVTRDQEMMNMLRGRIKQGLEVHKRTNVKTALVVPGRYDQRLHWDYQTANVIETMRMLSREVENSNMVLVMEPLNGLRDHPGLFLTTIPQSYMICKAVDHSHCRIVNDLYHQQITEGNLIPNIDMAWEYIAAFHCGDHPGRREPGTGEINYQNIFKHIYQKGYDGVICTEHGRSIQGKKGEQAFIDAYRWADGFEA